MQLDAASGRRQRSKPDWGFEMCSSTSAASSEARAKLDAHTREIVEWHFDPATGCPFWLDYAERLDFDPRRDIQTFDDLKRFEPFEDEWLRGGPVRRCR